MDAHSRNLAYIFEPCIRFIAPLFQRPYVWRKDKNWEPLWDSIRAAAERRRKENPTRPHFLGAIVLEQQPIPTGDVDSRQIIDGQQRLTTLQILLAAARDISLAVGAPQYHEAFKRLTENYVPDAKSALSVHKVWPTNRDRQHFSAVMTSGALERVLEPYPQDEKSEPRELIPAAYVYFYNTVKEFITDGGSAAPHDRLKLLHDTLRQDLVVVVIDLGSPDDPQAIFETLNALGTPLLPADLVKNFLFRRAEAERTNIEDLYGQYWRRFDDQSRYWREEVRQGRLQRPRIDLFLQHLLTLKKQDEVGVSELFASYKEYVEKGAQQPAQEHLRVLSEYADVYKGFEGQPRDTREGLFFYRLEELDTQTVKPVLLEVFKHKSQKENRDKILEYLESYLVRRAICGLTYSGYNRLFVDLIKRLNEAGFDSAEVRSFLLGRTGESGKWPSDDEVRKALLEEKTYTGIKRAYLRVVLEGIEREFALEDQKAKKVALGVEKLTIEHVMPVKWRAHWPLPDPSDKVAERKRDDLIHTLGNLTLVTKRLNPALSNGPWRKKREGLEKHAVLTINRRLLENSAWDDGAIRDRGKTMFGVVRKIWPYPIA